jgi:rhodanese-related sulfurtransferase
MAMPAKTTTISARQAYEWLSAGDAILIDVREPDEFRDEHIASATSLPLTSIGKINDVMPLPAGRKVIFSCLKGGRGEKACQAYAAANENVAEVFNIDGGISGWKADGLPVIGATRAGPRLTIFRQVQIAIGTLVLLSVLCGFFVHPAGFILAGLFGAALVLAGLSGWCGLAILLGRMPWNKAG